MGSKVAGDRPKPGVKGGPKPPGSGRKKGTPNKATRDVKELAKRILFDKLYQENLLARAREGALAPAVEVALYHYVAGKPKESVDVTTKGFVELVLGLRSSESE